MRASAALQPPSGRASAALLAQFEAVAGALVGAGWECLPHQDSDGAAMLVATDPVGTTWLVTEAPAGLRLQRMVDEAWLDTECEGPPTCILARLLPGPIAARGPSP